MPTSLKLFGKTYNNVAGFKALDTNDTVQTYGPSSVNLQAKTNIDATTSSQTITADAGYAGLSSVQINAATLQDKTVTANGTITCDSGFYGLRRVTVNVPSGGSTISNQDKTVTPTESQQSITYDSGYTGLGTVTVNRIPTNYLIPTGNKEITANGTNINVASYATVTVNVAGGGTPTIESLSITPSESEQTFNSSSVDGYKPITVSAISTTYVGSGITRRSSTDLSASGATVTVPAGYYESQATKSVSSMTLPTSAASSITSGYTSKATIGRSTSAQYINIPPGYNSAGAYYTISAVANGSATGPTSITQSSATVSTGTNTLTLTKTNVTTTPTVSAGYISSATASTATVALTASVTTKAAATYYAGTSDQTISASQYLTGAQTIKAVSQTNLTAANIKSGTTISISNGSSNIWSVTGTYSGGGSGSSMNVQTNQSTSRTTSTSLTSLNSLTCSTAGTYDVYWTCTRSSTSGTWNSQLYLGGTAYGSAQSTWSNHVQVVKLTGVSISANQTVAVYARSRGNNYYAYAPQLTIVQTA